MNTIISKKRLLAFLLCAFLTISIGLECLALDNVDITDGESVIVSIEQVASPSYSYTFSDGHEAYIHMGYVTSDDYSLGTPRNNARGNISWVYCMEFFVQAHSANTRVAAKVAKSNDVVWTGLSNAQKQGIELALLYGYPNSLNGTTAADSFAATQAVIWEFQTGVRNSIKNNTRQAVTYSFRTDLSTYDTLSLTEDYFYNIIATTPNGIAAYNDLVSKIYRHSLEPDFGLVGVQIPLTYDNDLKVYKTTLTDSNEVLSTYDVSIDSSDGATVTTSGNSLTITCPKKVTDTTLILEKKDQPTEGQQLMILTSSAYGQALVAGSGQVPVYYDYNVYSENDGSTIVVIKKDDETSNVLKGAVFALYDSKGKLVAERTTKANGKATFTNLNMGTYTVKEKKAPAGYNLYTKKINTITISAAGVTKTVTVRNTPLKLYIDVYKKGETLTGFTSETLETGETVYTPTYEENYLSDCKIEVYAAEDIYGPDGTFKYAKDTLLDTVVTSSDGPVQTKAFYPGAYYLREVEAPSGYVISSGDKGIVLTDMPGEVTFFDLRQRCDFNFQKIMNYTSNDNVSEYYKDVSFGIYNETDILDLPADSLLEVIRPDEYGNCVMSVELPYGYDYYLKEITTSDDFILDETEYSFSFTGLTYNDSTKIVEISEDNKIFNEMKPAVVERVLVETMTDDPSPNMELLALLVLLQGATLLCFRFSKKKLT